MKRTYDEYANAYPHVKMHRTDGVLTLQLHTDGGPLVWGAAPHEELGYCFQEVGVDRENRVIMITGTGDRFLADLDDSWVGPMSPEKWDRIHTNGRRLLRSLLDIEVPVIGVVNGPATVHAELALLSDIVLVADTAFFQDAPHFKYGTVPGDGVHLVWPLLLGPNRGRHFLLTGRRITAEEALTLGLVAEIVPSSELQVRAEAVARDLLRQPDLILRLTREAVTQQLRKLLVDGIGHGLALEGLGAYESWPTG